MLKALTFALSAVLILVAASYYTSHRLAAGTRDSQHAVAPAPASMPSRPAAAITVDHGRYMFNITLHTTEEINGMLRRAEQLAKASPAFDFHTGIALVLHGREIGFFAKRNYDRYKPIVDLARRLDEEGVVEIKMCQTAKRDLGVKDDDVPDFIELVPYAPEEIKRLERAGYIYL